MTNRVTLAELAEFLEVRCVGVDQSADAARWKLIRQARASEIEDEPLIFSRKDVEALIALAIAGKDRVESIQQQTARVIEEAGFNISRAIREGMKA